MKLITTKNYLLWVNEEAEIKIKSIVAEKLISGNYDLYEIHTKNDIDFNNQFVTLAYYPLTKEAKELDLPLLPNPFEPLESLYKKPNIKRVFANNSKASKAIEEVQIEAFLDGHFYGFEDGYKAAQQSNKQFSLEDMQKAFESGYNSAKSYSYKRNGTYQEDFNRFIQSLSTQKLPKEFIPDYENKCWCLKPVNDGCFECIKTLKTITNSEGKKEVQGHYIW